MIVVAVSVLPTLVLMLLVMDRVEDWLSGSSPAPPHARERRRLRLLPGGARESGSRPATASSERRSEAA
ncbi:hypothetical protein [Streptomyces iranensis]|uniref:Uncharacterized protein n=1 Tax=Streptomyces iranensis TaxID=576784 RepID=A0A061AAR9_9ACTN|nr:hypothetical protein [Streptomyces iranensis]MBP2067478.1 hypothetical protein [Streptomyces iranensis]CDR17516.1 predicted protein [Streptomyces iranensis]